MAREEGRPASPDYLFVLTRSLQNAASSRYLVRHAAQLRRGGHQVTLFLLSEAAWASGVGDVRLLADVRTCVLAENCPLDTIAANVPVVRSTEGDLLTLMLNPGVLTYWC